MSETATKTPPRRRSRLTLFLPLAVFLALAMVFLARLIAGGDPSAIPSALVGEPVPEFTLPPLEGLSRDGAPVPGFASADLEDGISVVNVFASWCGPCRQEHPLLEELARDPRVQMFGINYKDVPANAVSFLDGLGNPYQAVGVDTRGRTAIDWGVYGVPETFLVDGDGVIREKIVGPLSEQSLAEMLMPKIEALSAGE